MRIGITIRTSKGQNVWNGGLLQNVYFLAYTFRSISFVEGVVLINCGDHDRHAEGAGEPSEDVPLIKPDDVIDSLDVVVEMDAGLDPEWIRRFRARGGKVIFHARPQPHMELVGATVFKRDAHLGLPEHYDEVWALPKDREFCGMLEAIYRCPVREVPFLWSPTFLERSAQQVPSGSGSFGYTAGSLGTAAIRAAIFEPNLSPAKMGLVPLLICQEAERRVPNSVACIDFLNGKHLSSQASFIFFMRNLQLFNSEKIKIHGRDYFAHVMARGSNVVVSHQIDCTQNYLYLDALYGGYPLIHNSPLFKDAGYYYEHSNVSAGASALLEAVEHHDRNLNSYIRMSRHLLGRYSPTARHNSDRYSRRLISLMRGACNRRGA